VLLRCLGEKFQRFFSGSPAHGSGVPIRGFRGPLATERTMRSPGPNGPPLMFFFFGATKFRWGQNIDAIPREKQTCQSEAREISRPGPSPEGARGPLVPINRRWSPKCPPNADRRGYPERGWGSRFGPAAPPVPQTVPGGPPRRIARRPRKRWARRPPLENTLNPAPWWRSQPGAPKTVFEGPAVRRMRRSDDNISIPRSAGDPTHVALSPPPTETPPFFMAVSKKREKKIRRPCRRPISPKCRFFPRGSTSALGRGLGRMPRPS